MEFMELLSSWLYLRDMNNSGDDDNRSLPQQRRDNERMAELEAEINARMRGELPR